jgi:Flp pilus assembly protein TadG
MKASPRARAALSDESGAVLVLLAVSLFVILGATGLALDLGRGYLEKLRVGRAVDAAALAGARALRLGQATALNQANAVARANGVPAGPGTRTSVAFGTNARGENTVTVSSSRTVPTTFIRILGHTQMDVGSSATAAAPPVDLTLVVDQSGSLERENAWDDLQAAASSFVRQFNDGIDQMALVSFQIRATERFQMGHDFTTPIDQAIAAMSSAGDTNTGEGLRLAHGQMQLPAVRQSAAKVVVFFTDGRPTAVRDVIGPPFDLQDRVIAVSTRVTGNVRGLFDDPDNLPTDVIANPPDDCPRVNNCYGWNENRVRNQGRVRGEQMARAIRQDGILIYTIGLGNPNNPDPILQPDLDYLRKLANENGVAHPNEPQGKMYFAPTANDLQAVFDQVARDLFVRLSR